ncbi:MAG: K(+)-transporting ATPase subunit F [bacterium]|nr:K(+)-transporting ATPase subunit F [bacterium]
MTVMLWTGAALALLLLVYLLVTLLKPEWF